MNRIERLEKWIEDDTWTDSAKDILSVRDELVNLYNVIEAAMVQPGPGPIRDYEMWQHHPACQPLRGCSCGLSTFRQMIGILLHEVRP